MCILPDLDVLIENAQEKDLFWFDIFDENMKECNSKHKYQFQYTNIHEKDKKKDQNVYEQFSQIGIFRIRNKIQQSNSIKQTRNLKNWKIYNTIDKEPIKQDEACSPEYLQRMELKKINGFNTTT